MKMYFYCPGCKKLVSNLKASYAEINRYNVEIDGEDIQYLNEDTVDTEHLTTTCLCGYETRKYAPDDLLVIVDDKGKLRMLGDYFSLLDSKERRKVRREILKQLKEGKNGKGN